MSRFWESRQAYWSYIRALVTPGWPPISLATTTVQTGNVSKWADDDLDTLIEEGRRTQDRLLADIDSLRGRSQVAFTTGIALLAVIVSQLHGVAGHSPQAVVTYSLGWFLALYGAGGALASFVVQLEVEVISADVLSTYSPPVKAQLAQDYAEAVQTTIRTRDTLTTVLREAMLWLSLGGALDAATWVVTRG